MTTWSVYLESSPLFMWSPDLNTGRIQDEAPESSKPRYFSRGEQRCDKGDVMGSRCRVTFRSSSVEWGRCIIYVDDGAHEAPGTSKPVVSMAAPPLEG